MKYNLGSRLVPRAYEKSVVLGHRTLFPLDDPKGVAAKLKAAIWEAEDAAFAAGVEAARAEMKQALGLR